MKNSKSTGKDKAKKHRLERFGDTSLDYITLIPKQDKRTAEDIGEPESDDGESKQDQSKSSSKSKG